MEQEMEKERIWVKNVGRENQREWWRWLNLNGTELLRRAKDQGVKDKE